MPTSPTPFPSPPHGRSACNTVPSSAHHCAHPCSTAYLLPLALQSGGFGAVQWSLTHAPPHILSYGQPGASNQCLSKPWCIYTICAHETLQKSLATPVAEEGLRKPCHMSLRPYTPMERIRWILGLNTLPPLCRMHRAETQKRWDLIAVRLTECVAVVVWVNWIHVECCCLLFVHELEHSQHFWHLQMNPCITSFRLSTYRHSENVLKVKKYEFKRTFHFFCVLHVFKISLSQNRIHMSQIINLLMGINLNFWKYVKNFLMDTIAIYQRNILWDSQSQNLMGGHPSKP